VAPSAQTDPDFVFQSIPPIADGAAAEAVEAEAQPDPLGPLAQLPGTHNIIPFAIGSPPPPNSEFGTAEQEFPELNLSIPTQFRFASPDVTQEMVQNPNSVIQAALRASLQATSMKNRTFIRISTTHNPVPGGGTANTAFLASVSNPPGGNASAVEVDATFWIQTIAGTQGQPDKLQLQYTQLVQLDFNTLRWRTARSRRW
jgi:hypothetical protein